MPRPATIQLASPLITFVPWYRIVQITSSEPKEASAGSEDRVSLGQIAAIASVGQTLKHHPTWEGGRIMKNAGYYTDPSKAVGRKGEVGYRMSHQCC